MQRHKPEVHDSLKSSGFITATVLLAGFLLLGLGIGLAGGQPGFGLITGLGAGLVVVGLLRVRRGP